MPDKAMDAITAAIRAYRPRDLDTVEDGKARLAFIAATVEAVSWKRCEHKQRHVGYDPHEEMEHVAEAGIHNRHPRVRRRLGLVHADGKPYTYRQYWGFFHLVVESLDPTGTSLLSLVLRVTAEARRAATIARRASPRPR